MKYKDLKEMNIKDWDGQPFRAIVADNEDSELYATDVVRLHEGVAENGVLITGYNKGRWYDDDRVGWSHVYPMEQNDEVDKEIRVRKENAKLRCLALHGMFGYACAKMNVLAEKYEKEFASGMVHKDFSRWNRLSHLWLKEYRKAKAELKEKKIMNYEIMQKLFAAFPEGFINSENEFIADEKANIFFGLKNVETEKELFKKVIHFFSRPAFKSEPFSSKKRNDLLHAQFLKAVNKILETNFSEEQISKIYTHLGNGVNEPLTEKFINSGFDISVLENNDEA